MRRKLLVAMLVAAFASTIVLGAKDFKARAHRASTSSRRSSTGTTTTRGRCAASIPAAISARPTSSKPVPKLMTDIPRLRQGGMGAQFWSVYVPSTMQGKEAVRATLEQIDIVHRMTKQWPRDVRDRLHRRRDRALVQGGTHRLADRHGGRPLDRQLAGDAAHDARARRAAT